MHTIKPEYATLGTLMAATVHPTYTYSTLNNYLSLQSVGVFSTLFIIQGAVHISALTNCLASIIIRLLLHGL